MNKLALTTLTILLLNTFSPLMPAVHAATVDEQLLTALAQNPNVTQGLLRLKGELEKGNRQALLDSLAKMALTKSGKSDVTNILSNGDIRQVLQNAISQEVTNNVSEKIGPYQKELGMLAALLNSNQVLTPQTTRDSNSLLGAPANYKSVLNMVSTAYAPGTLDNGKWDKGTYMGGIVHKGVVAVDPSVIPMGTKLWVEGYGEAIAEDQGSAIKGNRIDLAFDDRQQALDYGIKNVKVYILE